MLVAVVAAIGLSIALDLGDRGVKLIGGYRRACRRSPARRRDRDCWLSSPAPWDGPGGTRRHDLHGDVVRRAARAEVDGNREMIAIGVANLGAGLFQGFPVSTSGSRTAVAESAGSRTQLTGLVGAPVIAVMLLSLPGLCADLASRPWPRSSSPRR